jgi:hypothetical protein
MMGSNDKPQDEFFNSIGQKRTVTRGNIASQVATVRRKQSG